MDKAQAYIERKEAELAQWQGELHELVKKAKLASGQRGRDMQFEVDDLKARCAAAQERLEQLKACGSDRWDALVDGVESAWDDLHASFKNRTDGRIGGS